MNTYNSTFIISFSQIFPWVSTHLGQHLASNLDLLSISAVCPIQAVAQTFLLLMLSSLEQWCPKLNKMNGRQ